MERVGVALAMMGAAYLYSQQNKNEQGNNSVIIKFYHAPWCGYCKRFYPEWERLQIVLGEKMKNVQFEKINCYENKLNCLRAGISSYPTLRFEINGKVIDYQGERSVEAIEESLISAIFQLNRFENAVEEAQAEAAEEEIEQGREEEEVKELDPLTCALFYDPSENNSEIMELWDKLSSIYDGTHFKLVKINCETEKALCESYKLESYPVIVFQLPDNKAAKFSGPMDFATVNKFLMLMGQILG